MDIVLVGCPHATFEEIRKTARLVKGRKVKEGVQLWVQTDTPSYFMSQRYEDAGGAPAQPTEEPVKTTNNPRPQRSAANIASAQGDLATAAISGRVAC